MTPPLTVSTAAAHSMHPRGIFEAEHTFAGMSTFRLYSCTGRLCERRELETALVDAQTRASMEWSLEHYCPADATKHGTTCPSDRSPASVLKLV